ncbi:hypothetical protein BKA69DRAFT_1091873 [Paraphysoderma sedebokerense]|nr:hypothetical protein BKA69DRAFT_1091873 [Paraphysoderma sedebokerense]
MIQCNIAAFFISFFFTARLDTTRQRRFLQNFEQSRLLLDPLEDRGTSQDVWVQQQFNSLRSELSEVRSLLSSRGELVGLRRNTSTNATATKSRLIPKISSNDSIIVWDKPKGLRRSARYLKKS